MTDPLNWGYTQHDFSPLQETIIHYFPIENPEQFTEENIRDFKGAKEMEAVLNDHFFTDNNYKARWIKFKLFLEQEMQKPIEETMVAFYPCYSGIVTLKKKTTHNFTYTQELHFFVSLLGPYYTLFGVDKAEITLEEVVEDIKAGEKIIHQSFEAPLVLTTSPYLEYKAPFLLLQKKIVEHFPTLRFVPYDINTLKCEGISLFYPDSAADVKDTVFSALFRPDNFFHSVTRGNTHFGFDEWLRIKKLSPVRIKEIREGFLKKSLEAGSHLTLHKVWKFKTVKQIPNILSKGMMFGLEVLDVLDLTEATIATLLSKENEEPHISPYSIVENEIRIESVKDTFSFKIKEMSSNELTLILHIHSTFPDNKWIQDPTLELLYEVYY